MKKSKINSLLKNLTLQTLQFEAETRKQLGESEHFKLDCHFLFLNIFYSNFHKLLCCIRVLKGFHELFIIFGSNRISFSPSNFIVDFFVQKLVIIRIIIATCFTEFYLWRFYARIRLINQNSKLLLITYISLSTHVLDSNSYPSGHSQISFVEKNHFWIVHSPTPHCKEQASSSVSGVTTGGSTISCSQILSHEL